MSSEDGLSVAFALFAVPSASCCREEGPCWLCASSMLEVAAAGAIPAGSRVSSRPPPPPLTPRSPKFWKNAGREELRAPPTCGVDLPSAGIRGVWRPKGRHRPPPEPPGLNMELCKPSPARVSGKAGEFPVAWPCKGAALGLLGGCRPSRGGGWPRGAHGEGVGSAAAPQAVGCVFKPEDSRSAISAIPATKSKSKSLSVGPLLGLDDGSVMSVGA